MTLIDLALQLASVLREEKVQLGLSSSKLTKWTLLTISLR